MPADRKLFVFYQTLAQFLRAGMPLVQALDACSLDYPPAGAASRMIQNGSSLAAALSTLSSHFPAEDVQVLALAAQTGAIDRALDDLAAYRAQISAARREVASGLSLPMVMLHTAFFIVPLPALFLGGTLGQYLRASLGAAACVWAVIGLAFFFFRKASPAMLSGVVNRLPLVRAAYRDLEWWRLTSALAMLSRTSADMPTSLRFAGQVCRERNLARALSDAAAAVEREGTLVSLTLRHFPCIPSEVVLLWQNGERTGTLDQTFARMAAHYASSFRDRLRAIATWLPKIVYGLVCVYLAVQVMHLARAYRDSLGGG